MASLITVGECEVGGPGRPNPCLSGSLRFPRAQSLPLASSSPLPPRPFDPPSLVNTSPPTLSPCPLLPGRGSRWGSWGRLPGLPLGHLGGRVAGQGGPQGLPRAPGKASSSHQEEPLQHPLSACLWPTGPPAARKLGQGHVLPPWSHHSTEHTAAAPKILVTLNLGLPQGFSQLGSRLPSQLGESLALMNSSLSHCPVCWGAPRKTHSPSWHERAWDPDGAGGLQGLSRSPGSCLLPRLLLL